jgi:hypothetical protein
VKLPNALHELGKMFKDAIKLEFSTNAGKLNALGLFLVVVLVALDTVTGWLEDFIRMYRPKAVAPPSDYTTIILIFVILFLICMCFVVVDDRKRRGDLPKS